jgi:GATA-binding protein
MAASTATPMAFAGSASTMHPTSTEHDYRFPRRPDHRMRNGITPADHTRATLREIRADLDKTYAAANNELLGNALFPSLLNADDTGPGSKQNLAQIQRDDPLATQIWKLFKQTKQQLPNQERMENMTWRMMALRMRNQRKEEQQNRHLRPAAHNAPSGIAQLRKTSEHNGMNSVDAMNIDDFIFSDNSMMTDTMSPQPISKMIGKSMNGAIPIKSRKEQQQQQHTGLFVPQSVPVSQQHQASRDEFNYVNRHHRKTSIDERLVSPHSPLLLPLRSHIAHLCLPNGPRSCDSISVAPLAVHGRCHFPSLNFDPIATIHIPMLHKSTVAFFND